MNYQRKINDIGVNMKSGKDNYQTVRKETFYKLLKGETIRDIYEKENYLCIVGESNTLYEIELGG